jgi:hypothetical protein
VSNSSGIPGQKFAGNHSVEQWQNRMRARGWTLEQIDEALQKGQKVPAVNQVNPANAASRYIHPTTRRSVVVDDVSGEVIHVGGDGFLY